jgi:hypothetical protein
VRFTSSTPAPLPGGLERPRTTASGPLPGVKRRVVRGRRPPSKPALIHLPC